MQLLKVRAALHPAALNDKVVLGMAVRIGVESRAELTFTEERVIRDVGLRCVKLDEPCYVK